MGEYYLIGSKGCGSAMVELALRLSKAPHRVENLPYLEPGEGRNRLLAINPTGQVPTLVLPDGTPMTETGAILLLLAERYPEARLAPAVDDQDRAAFLRWLMYEMAAIYSSFTYSDFPERFALDEERGKAFQQKVIDRRVELWQAMEAVAHGDYFLPSGRSAIDLCIAVMLQWTPGRKVHEQRLPKLSAIAKRITADPELANIMTSHFRSKKADP